jgi:hypothetical protein
MTATVLASNSFEMQCLIIFPFDVIIFRMRRFVIGERRFNRSSVAEPERPPAAAPSSDVGAQGGCVRPVDRRASRMRKFACIATSPLREARLVHASLFML